MKVSKVLALVSFLATLVVICFFTFRESPRLAEVSWMPPRWGLWLDAHAEVRHFVGMVCLSALAFAINFDSTFNRSRSRFVRRLRSSRNRTGRLGALLVLVYVLEFGQLVLPRREFDYMDIVNGWAGVLAVWLVWFVLKTRERRRRRIAHDRRHDPINVATIHFR